jgi:hypothetical protein
MAVNIIRLKVSGKGYSEAQTTLFLKKKKKKKGKYRLPKYNQGKEL